MATKANGDGLDYRTKSVTIVKVFMLLKTPYNKTSFVSSHNVVLISDYPKHPHTYPIRLGVGKDGTRS